MHITRFGLLVLLGAGLLFVGADTALTQSQQGGPGGWGGGRGMRGGGNFDPSRMAGWMFDRYAQGQDYIVIAQVQNSRDPEMKDRLTQFAEREGITNGRLTRDQFTKYMQERMAQRMANRGAPPGSTPGAPSAAPGTPGGNNGGPVDEAQLRERFQRQDRDGDGKLTPNEVGGRLGQDFALWDKNRDGAIDFNEYKDYYIVRQQQRSESNQWQGAWLPVQEPPPEDPRPTVYRAGNLPRELLDRAPWFQQLDRDRDGQVGLYEWKEAGRTLDDFRTLDLNGDGFVTAEEALRYIKKTSKGASGSDTLTAFGGPGGGMFPRGGPGGSNFPGRPGGWNQDGGNSGGPGRWQGRGMFPRSSDPSSPDGGDFRGRGGRGGRGGRWDGFGGGFNRGSP